ncbi:MAG: helix-turn-helix transcriptional regulator, partial [Planctomycetes bacterium]|nr:helix-turn-helix transcriptional regulator [Planctomycetota bacterium]
GASQANVSKHLSTLTAEGILARRKEGLFVFYRVVDDTIYSLCEAVCGSLAERFAQAGSHFA